MSREIINSNFFKILVIISLYGGSCPLTFQMFDLLVPPKSSKKLFF